jgi:hypothetical protein
MKIIKRKPTGPYKYRKLYCCIGLSSPEHDKYHALKHIAVIGSQNYPDLDRVVQCVEQLPSDAVIISGGDNGVDLTAEESALSFCMKVTSVRSDESSDDLNKNEINDTIVDLADRIVVFLYSNSEREKYIIDLAKKNDKPLEIHEYLPDKSERITQPYFF